MRLMCESLRKVFDGRTVAQALRGRVGHLDLEDGLASSREQCGVLISTRDFARLGWLWLKRGRWSGDRVLSAAHFRNSVKIRVPRNIRVATATPCNDYLAVGTFGGGCTYTALGPGLWGYAWWFNGTIGGTRNRLWPAVPIDTFVADGDWDARFVVVIPSLNIVAVTQQVHDNEGPDPARMNDKLRLLAEAVLD